MPPPPPLQHRQNGRTQCHEKPKKLSFADNAVSHATPATPSPNAPLSIPQHPSIHTGPVFGPKYSSIRPCRLQYSGRTTGVFGLEYSGIRPQILEYSVPNTTSLRKFPVIYNTRQGNWNRFQENQTEKSQNSIPFYRIYHKIPGVFNDDFHKIPDFFCRLHHKIPEFAYYGITH